MLLLELMSGLWQQRLLVANDTGTVANDTGTEANEYGYKRLLTFSMSCVRLSSPYLSSAWTL